MDECLTSEVNENVIISYILFRKKWPFSDFITRFVYFHYFSMSTKPQGIGLNNFKSDLSTTNVDDFC